MGRWSGRWSGGLGWSEAGTVFNRCPEAQLSIYTFAFILTVVMSSGQRLKETRERIQAGEKEVPSEGGWAQLVVLQIRYL